MAEYGLNDLFAELRTAETPIASTVHEPVGNPAGPGLWHHKGLQLPAYVQHVANELKKQGHDESSAVRIAVGVVKNWAAGHDGAGHKVHPDVQAAAAKAVAEWEALKASASGGKRFNPFHAPAGPGGGEFSSGGGGGGSAKAAAAKPPAHGAAAAAQKTKNAVKKHQLLQRATADRAKAHALEQELHVLEGQLHAHQQAAAAASHAQKAASKTKAAAAAAGKKGGAATKQAKAAASKTKAKVTHVHHHTAHHHHAKAVSLKQHISSLRTQISDLLAQADHLTAQAKAL